MVDDRLDEDGSSPARPKRAPPTIDLQATEVSSEPPKSSDEAGPEATSESEPPFEPERTWDEPVSEPTSESSPPNSRPISPWVVAPLSGAAAAALVIGVGGLLGWPSIQPASTLPPQPTAAAIDGLTGRVASLESRTGKPPAPVADPAASARMDELEKSLAALRGELAAARAQSEHLASALNEVKSAPRDGAAALPDLSAIETRIGQIESAVRAQGSEIAQQQDKIAETQAADAKPADDAPLRRVVAASLLDLAVRQGEAYAPALAAAKPLADNADALKPLEIFAASGVPSANGLCRELLDIAPKLAPPATDNATTGTGIVDRLQAGAAKLVRIQRIDAGGTDRTSVAARVTAAAQRNDLEEARRELKTLAPSDRAAAQAWLDKADARDAALAASRNFADSAMAALATAKQ